MTTQNTPVASDRLALTPTEAAEMLSISRAQFFKLHAAGKLPLPVRLSARCPRWRADELRDWLAADCPDRETWVRLRKT